MAQLPSSTVIVCTRNRSLRLLDACEAILRIDYPRDRWRFLIVDNDSTDDSLDVARSLAEKHPDLVRLHVEKTLGLSAARSFGLSHDIPIVGVTTLEAVAVTLPEPEAGQPLRAGVIAFDARNDEVYLQVVDPLGTLVVAPSVVDLATAADAVPEGLVNLSGSGAPRLADALAARSRAADVNVVDESLWAPQAEWIARLALVAPDDRVGPPSPLYLRPPDAKEPENGGALPHA